MNTSTQKHPHILPMDKRMKWKRKINVDLPHISKHAWNSSCLKNAHKSALQSKNMCGCLCVHYFLVKRYFLISSTISCRILQLLTEPHVFTSYKRIQMHMFVQLFCSANIFLFPEKKIEIGRAAMRTIMQKRKEKKWNSKLWLWNLIETNFLVSNACSVDTAKYMDVEKIRNKRSKIELNANQEQNEGNLNITKLLTMREWNSFIVESETANEKNKVSLGCFFSMVQFYIFLSLDIFTS